MTITDPHATHFVTNLGFKLGWTNTELHQSGSFPPYAVWTAGIGAEVVETFNYLSDLYAAWPELRNLPITVVK